MTLTFSYAGSPARVVFGNGARKAVGEWVVNLGCRRPLVLTTPAQRADGELLADQLGSMSAGVFGDAAMHTPVEITDRAISYVQNIGADCLIAFGGGSTTGLSKAIAYRLDLPQIVLPTTYAGSEVTSILGQTENGVKTTIKSERVLPEVVLYDPELTRSLPVNISVTSGLNAMAHAIEGLYAQDRNPISTLMAVEGVKALRRGLPAIVNNPDDLDGRGDALYGAWLCGAVLGTVGMSLHHKICHTLGGSFDLPHAETHSVMLPHTIAYNASATAALLAPIEELFAASPGKGLYAFAASLGAPTALRDLGLKHGDLDKAAKIASKDPYWNPRSIEEGAIRSLLAAAWEGTPPEY